MLLDIPEDDGEGKTFSESVGTLAWSGGVDASHFGEQPRSWGVDPFKVLFRSSGHEYISKKYFIKLII